MVFPRASDGEMIGLLWIALAARALVFPEISARIFSVMRGFARLMWPRFITALIKERAHTKRAVESGGWKTSGHLIGRDPNPRQRQQQRRADDGQFLRLSETENVSSAALDRPAD